jgi:hypothetical protein
MEELKQRYDGFENIHLINPIYDQNILNQIRSNCHIYIHGHSAGGTNPSLVEAMYLRLPIFSFGVGYNRATTENKAKYFNNKEQLIELLKNIDESELKNVASDMKRIANENYTCGKDIATVCKVVLKLSAEQQPFKFKKRKNMNITELTKEEIDLIQKRRRKSEAFGILKELLDENLITVKEINEELAKIKPKSNRGRRKSGE